MCHPLKLSTPFTKVLMLITSMSWVCADAYAQDTLFNQYTYIHSIQKKIIDPEDSFRVRTGFWMEYDTVSVPVIIYVTGGEKEIINQGRSIYTAKGNYLRNLKTGTWKYYDSNGVLYKEVAYSAGVVYGMRYFYPDGVMRSSALSTLGATSFDYEQYDKDGKKIATGKIPSEFIQAAINMSGY